MDEFLGFILVRFLEAAIPAMIIISATVSVFKIMTSLASLLG